MHCIPHLFSLTRTSLGASADEKRRLEAEMLALRGEVGSLTARNTDLLKVRVWARLERPLALRPDTPTPLTLTPTASSRYVC